MKTKTIHINKRKIWNNIAQIYRNKKCKKNNYIIFFYLIKFLKK